MGWGNWETVALAVGLAFVSGYGTTLLPLARAGMPLSTALPLAFASDTLSITTMEIVDNALMWLIPGAMNADLTDPVFWDSLFVSLILAGVAAFPVNLWLIQRGRGPAVAHAHLYFIERTHGVLMELSCKTRVGGTAHHAKKNG